MGTPLLSQRGVFVLLLVFTYSERRVVRKEEKVQEAKMFLAALQHSFMADIYRRIKTWLLQM